MNKKSPLNQQNHHLPHGCGSKNRFQEPKD
jgi:hypothetical protein